MLLLLVRILPPVSAIQPDPRTGVEGVFGKRFGGVWFGFASASSCCSAFQGLFVRQAIERFKFSGVIYKLLGDSTFRV